MKAIFFFSIFPQILPAVLLSNRLRWGTEMCVCVWQLIWTSLMINFPWMFDSLKMIDEKEKKNKLPFQRQLQYLLLCNLWFFCISVKHVWKCTRWLTFTIWKNSLLISILQRRKSKVLFYYRWGAKSDQVGRSWLDLAEQRSNTNVTTEQKMALPSSQKDQRPF